jgi:hypothetical protein
MHIIRGQVNRRQIVPNKETHRKDTQVKEATPSVAEPNIQPLIETFKFVHPSYEPLFNNTAEHAALTPLVTKYNRGVSGA